ncbi:MAG TPA: lysylphosphatidylglycerol synthase transmembrane domain-containing protein, partial [Acidobacteriota bacterium]|nr:lysylphosphatidylglycerol synthase transmembrane domain-containing protein [Acidobacteriota bacterium]
MRIRAGWLRIAGLLLLGFLIWKLDASAVLYAIKNTHPVFLLAAIVLNVPQIFTKALRWRFLLLAQDVQYSTTSASLAYFGSIFIGLLTPGRLGEFVKTIHVSKDCGISSARAFSSVLVDRLFDLYALLLFGAAGLFSTSQQQSAALVFLEAALLLVLPLIAILHSRTFEYIQSVAMRSGKLGQKLFGESSWLQELRNYLMLLKWKHILIAIFFTVIAYALFFGQCFLLARGMKL